MLGVSCNEPEDLPDYPDVSDEEVDIRLQIFLNGVRVVEKSHRKRINNLSFKLNKKILEGCQAKELIQSYNEGVRRLLDDFVF